MLNAKVEVLEPQVRYIGSATLLANTDASWSIGPDPTHLVKVTFSGAAVDDSTFGFSAVAAESNGQGGYRLFVRNDADNNMIVEVKVNAAGHVDPTSVAVLDKAQTFAVEDQYKVDLNDSGGFGSGPVLLEGGAVNLYMSEVGFYQVGTGTAEPMTLTLGGQGLDDQLLPAGWEIVEAVAKGADFEVFAQAPTGEIFDATFDATGAYTSGSLLSGAAMHDLELSLGVDIDGNHDLPAPAGWTSILKNDAIRHAVEQALSSTATGQSDARALSAGAMSTAANTITYAELVTMFKTVIQAHKDSNDAPITAQEVADLQALAARGKAAFAGEGAAADYLSFVLGKMVDGSDANRFFNGGETQRSELGSLGAGSSVSVAEKLVSKWLLGGDMPSTATAGDSATGAPKAVTTTYGKSSGTLFVDGITVTDVVQGTAGDCYLIAAMGGLAASKPDALQAMFVDNGTIDGVRSWGVRFFDANGQAQWVTVNDMLPVNPSDTTKVAFAGSASKDLNGEIWVPLMEKAYAQANSLAFLPRAETTGQNSFAAIEGGQGDPLGALIAGKVISYSFPGANFGNNGYIVTREVDRSNAAATDQLVLDLKGLINAGKTVWLGVNDALKDAAGNSVLVGGHAHFMIDPNPADPNNTDVLVYNPWGISGASDNFVSPATMSLAQLVGIAGLDFMVLDTPAG